MLFFWWLYVMSIIWYHFMNIISLSLPIYVFSIAFKICYDFNSQLQLGAFFWSNAIKFGEILLPKTNPVILNIEMHI